MNETLFSQLCMVGQNKRRDGASLLSYMCLIYISSHLFVQVDDEEREAQRYIRNYVVRKWCTVYCTMIRLNLIAYKSDTREGIRGPRISAGAS